MLDLMHLRLDKLNIPQESLRNTDPLAFDDEALALSLETHGVLVPIIVHPFGDSGEYAVIDGTRRITTLRKNGSSGKDTVPALIVEADDPGSVVQQIQINNTRRTLSDLALAEGARQLLEDHGWKQEQVAAELGRSQPWVASVHAVWSKLPPEILDDLRSGRLAYTQAVIMTTYTDDPDTLAFLHGRALDGTSSGILQALGEQARRLGLAYAERWDDAPVTVGRKGSRLRLRPQRTGYRFDVTVNDGDSAAKILADVREYLEELGLLEEPAPAAVPAATPAAEVPAAEAVAAE